MKRSIILSLAGIILLLFGTLTAQTPNLVLLSLSAHPDDEDGSALAYYARIKNVDAYSLFFTGGEGGQNETGSQLGDDLGAIRRQETRDAAAIIGADVLFLGFPDFGFSKTATETFSQWGGRDSVVARLVYAIRALKPDVIITNHDTVTTKPFRQHGNHQAVGIVAFEAFHKAADPLYHPEQVSGNITPWQAKKLFFRYFIRGQGIPDSVVTIATGSSDPSGVTIEQRALQALQQHRSQGMDKLKLDSIPSYFRQHVYRLMRSDQSYPYSPDDLFAGITPHPRQSADWKNIVFSPVVLPSPQPGNPKSITSRFTEDVNLGIVATYDSTLTNICTAFNIRHTLLDSFALAAGDLDRFSTIVLDLRAYAGRPDLVAQNQRLLSYISGGGNVVCFYHKPGDWNGRNFAPYPLTLTNERVTEEDAPVTPLLPDHRLLTFPNRITAGDWSGWVQERNIYLPSGDTAKTSPRYERLLAMSDTGEEQPPTSLLTANYGKGTYTYVALALYRQLRFYHEGALKLFFNLISQPRSN